MEMTLGERIRKARKGMMTQAELANLIGVHEITVRRWELGERLPDTEALKKLSQVLGVSTSELMGEDMDTPGDPAPKVPGQTKDLIYEWEGHRLALPNTPETREMFERIVMQTMHNPAMI